LQATAFQDDVGEPFDSAPPRPFHPSETWYTSGSIARKNDDGHLSVVVAYAPPEEAHDEDKDLFFDQLESAINCVPRHDQLILLNEFNVVTDTDRAGFEQVVGNHRSGSLNDNKLRLLTFCAAHGLSILGSWFQHRNLHRFTWISNDHRTRKKIDHIITRDRTAFISCRVYRGAECPANTNHRLLIAKMKLWWWPAVHSSNQPTKYDTLRLIKDDDLAQRYSVDISNKFQALSSTEEDVESQWAAISSAIKKSADVVVGRRKCARKPWLADEAFDIVQKKLTAWKQGDHQECNHLRRLFDKTAKNDREQFYNHIADKAEARSRNGTE